MLLAATTVQVPVGHIIYRDAQCDKCSHYFTVAAGVSADAHFMSRLDLWLKRRFGYALYMVEGLRVLATHSFSLLKAAYVAHESHKSREEEVSQLLAVRIREFGGILHTLAPGATLHKDRLCSVAFKTHSRLQYLGFILAIICKRKAYSHKIELLDAVTV